MPFKALFKFFFSKVFNAYLLLPFLYREENAGVYRATILLTIRVMELPIKD